MEVHSSYSATSLLVPQLHTRRTEGPPDSQKNTHASEAGITEPGSDPQSSVSGPAAQKNDAAGDDKRQREKLNQQRIEQQEQAEIKQLAARDREVRNHEQAHMAVGGQYAGAAVYDLKRGPDGVNYAVGGEVPISTSKESTPEATLRKAQVIRRAALAPAEPSPQDRRVAALATRMEAEARVEIVKAQMEETEKVENSATENAEDDSKVNGSSKPRADEGSVAEAEQTVTPTPYKSPAIVSYMQIGRAEVADQRISTRV